MKYDGLINIATGSSRKSVNWKNKQMLWSALAERLKTVTRTSEKQEEYKSLPKVKRDAIKDVGGFVGGCLKGGHRKSNAVTERRLLTLDLDYVHPKDTPWETVELVLGCAAIMYSTHSHTAKSPRLRLVIPLSRPVTPDEYIAVARKVANDIGIDMCDDTTYEPHRLMYWPSASLDSEYIYRILDAPWLDPDEQLRRYQDWRDTSEWPVSSRKQSAIQRLSKKQEDPTEKKGVVGAFCRVYTIDEVIEKFLPEVYTKCGDDRYTYTGGSTIGGLVLYDNEKFAYSHHGSDPISGRLCNAFDLVRLHRFGAKDAESLPDTPITKLPSYIAMCECAITDEAVRKELALTKMAELSDKWDENEDNNWLGGLTYTAKGEFAATIQNVYLIMINDPVLKGKYYYDAFKERPIVNGDLPWEKLENRISECWTDADDSGLRCYLENTYNISNNIKIRDAVEIAMLERKRHPVREYLESLEWDGIKRADTIFIDYLGAEDTIYVREVTRKSLVGAVARIYEPGCKHDHMLVLVGPQGCRKSTTLAKLGKDWFSDSLYTVSGKDAYEQLQGHWIIEMGEMAATRRAELEQIKQFMSKQSDSYRAAYARRTQEHLRQCAFFGTTNDTEFLRDPTGNRRYWPIVVSEKGKQLGALLTDETVNQVWAEIVIRYKAGEQWYLSDEIEKMARKAQDAHTETNAKKGLIENFLEILLPKDWENMSLDKRLLFLSGGFGEPEKGTEKRMTVCALEIWQELFRGDPKNFTQMQAREINNILRSISGWKNLSSVNCGIYGRQRAFVRQTDINLK